jgi:predicted dehydrogenase
MTGLSRRALLTSTVAPLVLPARARGANDRIAMGFIGVGGQGGGHLRAMVRQTDVRVTAICDVMANRRNSAKDLVDSTYRDNRCKTYNDFREMLAAPEIDAVLLAVPDHWHVLIGLEAARRGKHMYYEKPMGVSLAESQAMRAAVKRYGITFQFGTQQRSSATFRHAVELVRNGRIGQLKEIVIGSANSQYVPNQPAQPVPEGFDYEMWLGPAPWKPYTAERVTRNWTLIYDYSLGCISGAWGVHDVDTAQWAVDADDSGPIEVEGDGAYPSDGLYDTAISWEIHHRYANGVKLIHTDIRSARKRWSQFSLGNMASLFLGTEGWVYVSRQAIRTQPESLVREKFGPNAVRVIHSNDHRRNFLDAVRTGGEPISGIEAAVRADTVCQQADIAMRLKRKLRWDPGKEQFINDEQANRMLSRPMRSPWHL